MYEQIQDCKFQSHKGLGSRKKKSLQLTNQQGAQVATVEIVCLHKIFPSNPMRLLSM